MKETKLNRNNSFREYEVIFILMGVAACLFLYRIDVAPLGLDEAISYFRSKLPYKQMFQYTVSIDKHTPLYYGLLHLWLLFEQTEFWLRSLSVVWAVLTVPLVYLLGRVIGGPRVGVVVAILFVTAPFHVRYAQEARMYTMLTFFASLAMLGLALALKQRDDPAPPWIGAGLGAVWRAARRKRPLPGGAALTNDLAWSAYVIGTAGALYSHNTAVFLPLAAILVYLFSVRGIAGGARVYFGNFLIANFVAFAIYSPWLPYLYHQSRTAIGKLWIKQPQWQEIIYTFKRAYGNVYVDEYLLGIILGSLLLFSFIVWIKRKQWHWVVFTLCLWLVLPLGELLVGAFVQPIFLYRTLIWTSIPVYLALAAGLSALRPRPVFLAALAVMAGFNLYGLNKYYEGGRRWGPEWDKAAALVAERARPDDVMLFCPSFLNTPFRYYFEPVGVAVAQYGVRRKSGQFVTTTLRRWSEAEDKYVAVSRGAPAPADLFSIHPRVWLIYRYPKSSCDPKLQLRDTFAARGKLVSDVRLSRIQLFLFEGGT